MVFYKDDVKNVSAALMDVHIAKHIATFISLF